MVHTWDVTLPALTGDAPRRAYVYLPEAAAHERCAVLYMFDGHNVFFDDHATYGTSWGMADALDALGLPLIVAAVECNHDPNGGRLSEYSPFPFPSREFGVLPGRGQLTMEWFVNEFKPYIDANFPTLPDRRHTMIAGSSMGGLMSLYAVTAYNYIFSRAAALSPSIWFAAERLDALLTQAKIAPETVVYMDYGSHEMKFHRNMARQFARVTGQLLERGVWLTSRIVPRGDHCEACWSKQIPLFLQTLFYDL